MDVFNVDGTPWSDYSYGQRDNDVAMGGGPPQYYYSNGVLVPVNEPSGGGFFEKLVDRSINAVGDVLKVGASAVVLPIVATRAVVMGDSVSQAIADLPGSKNEALMVAGTAALTVGGAYLAAPEIFGAGAAAESTAGVTLTGVTSAGEITSTALAPLETSILSGGSAGFMSGIMPTLATDIGAGIDVGAGYGLSSTVGAGTITAPTSALATVAGAGQTILNSAKTVAQIGTSIAGTAKAIENIASGGAVAVKNISDAANSADTLAKDAQKKQDDIFLISAVAIATAFFM